MERGSFSNGGQQAMMKLPIGFRFRPTDEELLLHYLTRKALSLPLPAPVILDFDVFISHPNSLPGDMGEKRRYYFCKGKGLGSKGMNLTATSCGFWKTSGKVKQIVASSCDGSNRVLGTRKLWTFYHKSGPLGWSRTPWVMHQFQLPKSPQNLDGDKQEWGVCRVFQRKRRANKHGYVASNPLTSICNEGGFELPTYIDFKLEENSSDLGPPEPCSPCSTASNSSTSGKELAQGEQLSSQPSFSRLEQLTDAPKK